MSEPTGSGSTTDDDLHRLATDEPPATTHFVDEAGFLVDEHGRYIDDEGYLLEAGYAVPAAVRPADDDPSDDDDPGGVAPGDDDDPGGVAPGASAPGVGAENGTAPRFDRLAHDGPEKPPISRTRHLRRKADQAGPKLQQLVESVRRPREGPDYVELPGHHGGGRKTGIAVLVIVALLTTAFIGVYVWYQRQVDPPGPPGAAVTVTIPEGTSTSGIAAILEKDGIISNATVFEFWVSRHKPGTLQAGTLTFRKNSSFDDVVKVLTKKADVVKVAGKVTIPEGFTLSQIEERLAAAYPSQSKADLDNLLSTGRIKAPLLPPGQTSLEGLLFPATYQITQGEPAEKVLQQMADTFQQTADGIGLQQGVASLTPVAGRPITPYEAVIVASLIQSEAGNEAEMPKIATVIYNRLRQGIPLGIDATTTYEANRNGTKPDFESRSPYNTRRVQGLPPTPISSPGKPALLAALNPTPGPWTYYVLEAPGRHFFTDSPAEFDQAVARCRAAKLGC